LSDSEPDPHNRPLFADEFTAADQPFLAGLRCGAEPWAQAATEWIKSSEVLDSIDKHGTKVWIYRNSEEDDAIVGFSSLAATGWQKWPPPDGKRSRLLYIPQLGLDEKFRGYPPDPEWRYSNQILEHLIGEAKLLAQQIRIEKPPSKHVDLLTLKVHRENAAARKVYERYGFELLPGFQDKEHFMMSHRLELGE
jgi:ribosomal protein S18 acetylase RimI-like enzyme